MWQPNQQDWKMIKINNKKRKRKKWKERLVAVVGAIRHYIVSLRLNMNLSIRSPERQRKIYIYKMKN